MRRRRGLARMRRAMSNLPIAWITHPECLAQEMPGGHPESPQRLRAIEDRLGAAGIPGFLQRFEAPAAPVAAIARVHDRAHIDRVLHADTRGGPVSIDAD